MKQEALDRLTLLVDSSPRCKCGGDCELLKSLAAQILDIQFHEIGFSPQCPSCSEPLFFDVENSVGRYNCKRCRKWFRYGPGTAPVEIGTGRSREPLADYR